MTRAVVFAYHDVGVRCLSVALAHALDVRLVVTHRDDPKENVWFASVERLAREHGIDVETPEDPGQLLARLQSLAPDFLFSFYYRLMLSPRILACARRGAFNMHGSLLPKYRGRAPVNWAVLRGERETGAKLHEMVAKPDAGRIVDQMAVPILPDDLAVEVLRKVTVAAEVVLDRALPRLIAGDARLAPQDLAQGSYFGARRPEDGRIDWTRGAREIHDLVRAVAPPYPGAFTPLDGARLRLLRTRVGAARGSMGAAQLLVEGADRLVARCADGASLEIIEADLDARAFPAAAFRERFGRGPVPLGS